MTSPFYGIPVTPEGTYACLLQIIHACSMLLTLLNHALSNH